MNRLIILLFLSLVFVARQHKETKTSNMEEQQAKKENEISSLDTAPKVIGIGGIFFFSDNPSDLKDWYSKNLGIEISEWGSANFEGRDLNNPEKVNSLQWMPFKKGSDYFAPSEKEFMINYRVQNIEGLVKQLSANGATVLDSIASYDFGKFVHIMDAEGNKIELWEPAD